MVSYTRERHVVLPLFKARWLSQTFVHWPYDPRSVQALLPPGLTVDTYEDAAWVGFTPFVMSALRPGVLPPTPSSFAETNLRTFVHRPDGLDGLWFLSLEVAVPAMLAGWLIGAPYHLGVLQVRKEGATVRYAGVRRGGFPSYRLAVRPGEPIDPDPRDVWLISRWRAFTRTGRVLWQTSVDHEPWPLCRAEAVELRQTLTAAAGLPAPAGPPVLHFSPRVSAVRFALPHPVRRH
ncbi:MULTISPECIES: YqjF family protein [unclassified Streptomyces]|uniref:YqjF family protein n=1 Tax=unclassified Streptomyces TaxID=2593676 RepID=UPI003D8EAB11